MSDQLPPTQPPLSAPTAPIWSQPVANYGMLATDQRAYGGWVVVAWVITLLTFGYTLPTAVAASRGKSNTGAICVLNILTGWTIIGWIASLVMACMSHQFSQVGAAPYVAMAHQYAPAQPVYAAAWYPAPDGIGQQYWDGKSWTEHRAP